MVIHCAAAAEHGGMGPYGGELIKKESSRVKLKAFPTNVVTSDGIGVASAGLSSWGALCQTQMGGGCPLSLDP